MNTKKWGPPAWDLLPAIGYNYSYNLENITEEDIYNYKNFFYYLGKVLPCRYCRESYNYFTSEMPIHEYLENKRLFDWIYNIHCKVNNKLRFQGNDITIDPNINLVKKYYDSYRANTCTTLKSSNNLSISPYNKNLQYFVYNEKCSN